MWLTKLLLLDCECLIQSANIAGNFSVAGDFGVDNHSPDAELGLKAPREALSFGCKVFRGVKNDQDWFRLLRCVTCSDCLDEALLESIPHLDFCRFFLLMTERWEMDDLAFRYCCVLWAPELYLTSELWK